MRLMSPSLSTNLLMEESVVVLMMSQNGVSFYVTLKPIMWEIGTYITAASLVGLIAMYHLASVLWNNKNNIKIITPINHFYRV